MGNAGIGHAGHKVHLGARAARRLVAGHDGAIAVAHHFHVHTLVIGVRVPVVHPHERAHLHLVACRREHLNGIGRKPHDLRRAQLVLIVITQLVIGEALEGDAVAVIVGAHEHRQAAHKVAGRNDVAILGHNKQTTAIKLTITKVNNTRMATVMFPKQCLRGIGQKSTYRL